MKRSNSINKLYKAAFLADNRVRRYNAPQNFWQKVLLSIAQDKHTVVIPVQEKIANVVTQEGDSINSVIESPVRIPMHSVISTRSAVVELVGEPIR